MLAALRHEYHLKSGYWEAVERGQEVSCHMLRWSWSFKYLNHDHFQPIRHYGLKADGSYQPI